MKPEKQLLNKDQQEQERKEKLISLNSQIFGHIRSIESSIDCGVDIAAVCISKFFNLYVLSWFLLQYYELQLAAAKNPYKEEDNQRVNEAKAYFDEATAHKEKLIETWKEGKLSDTEFDALIVKATENITAKETHWGEVYRIYSDNRKKYDSLLYTTLIDNLLPVSLVGIFVVQNSFLFYPYVANKLLVELKERLPLDILIHPIQPENFYKQDVSLLERRKKILNVVAVVNRQVEYFAFAILITFSFYYFYFLFHKFLNSSSDTNARLGPFVESFAYFAQAMALAYFFNKHKILPYFGYFLSENERIAQINDYIKTSEKQLARCFFNHGNLLKRVFNGKGQFVGWTFGFTHKNSKIKIGLNGIEYQISRNKFISEVAIALTRSGCPVMPAPQENIIFILDHRHFSNKKLEKVVASLQENLLQLAKLSEFKAKKLQQLNLISSKLFKLPENSWECFKLGDETSLKYILDITSLNESEKQSLTEQLLKLYGNENVTVQENCVHVDGYQLVTQKKLHKCLNKSTDENQFLKTTAKQDSSSQQNAYENTTTSITNLMSFWNKSSAKISATPKPKVKLAEELNSHEGSNTEKTSCNNNAIENDWKLKKLKEKYGQNVYRLKAKWLPVGQFYYGVIDYKKIDAAIKRNYKDGSEQNDVSEKFRRCIKTLKNAVDTHIKSNNPKNKDKSHGAGVFSSGKELYADSNGNSRLGLFKVKTTNNARLHGDVVQKNVESTKDDEVVRTEQVTVIKFRGFEPNAH